MAIGGNSRRCFSFGNLSEVVYLSELVIMLLLVDLVFGLTLHVVLSTPNVADKHGFLGC